MCRVKIRVVNGNYDVGPVDVFLSKSSICSFVRTVVLHCLAQKIVRLTLQRQPTTVTCADDTLQFSSMPPIETNQILPQYKEMSFPADGKLKLEIRWAGTDVALVVRFVE